MPAPLRVRHPKAKDDVGRPTATHDTTTPRHHDTTTPRHHHPITAPDLQPAAAMSRDV